MTSDLKPDLTEIVFRNRNREYGAYELRHLYVRNTTRALIIGTLALLLLIFIPVIKEFIAKATAVEELNLAETTAVLEEPPPMDENEPPPPPDVQPPPPPQRAQMQFVPPTVVPDEEAPEETIATIEEIKEIDIGTKDVEGDKDAPPDIGYVEPSGKGTVPVEVAAPEPEKEYEAFEVSQFPVPSNMDAIKKNLIYPEMCKAAGIQGKVQIKILVGKDGKPVKHVVKKTPHTLLAQACEKEIYKLQFTPGLQNGKPVPVWVMVPFDFKLH